MYFTVELNGTRKVVKASKKASIGQVTAQAFGPTIEDAKVVHVGTRKDPAYGALMCGTPLLEALEVR